jgi:uncharacterized protein (TIGR02001 family)
MVMALLAGISAAPANAVDVTAELGLVSDYRYRGYSLSDGRPAAQGSVTIEHDSGAYASLWASTVDEPGADIELDFIGGYWLELSDALSLDLSAAYYAYPGGSGSNYVEATAALERSKGPETLKAGFSYAPKQHGTRDENGRTHASSYLFASASYALPRLPLTVSAELGHEQGYFDEVERGGKWDWCLSGKIVLDRLRLGLAYSGTDAGQDALVASLFVDLGFKSPVSPSR